MQWQFMRIFSVSSVKNVTLEVVKVVHKWWMIHRVMGRFKNFNLKNLYAHNVVQSKQKIVQNMVKSS